MEIEERRVDGNAAAGLLGEIISFDITMAKTWCATCGRMEPAGAELVYADAPGMVMRCMHCESVLMKIVHGEGRYWLDMRGVACLQITET
ncbi:MAG TPA: DUF6510 family protein [Chloroflexota bacterium]